MAREQEFEQCGLGVSWESKDTAWERGRSEFSSETKGSSYPGSWVIQRCQAEAKPKHRKEPAPSFSLWQGATIPQPTRESSPPDSLLLLCAPGNETSCEWSVLDVLVAAEMVLRPLHSTVSLLPTGRRRRHSVETVRVDCVVYTERWIGGAINCLSATDGIQVGKPRPLLFPVAVFS